MRQDLTVVLKVSSLLVFLVFFSRFPKAVFQAQKKFLSDALIDMATSALRLLLTLLLIYFSLAFSEKRFMDADNFCLRNWAYCS